MIYYLLTFDCPKFEIYMSVQFILKKMTIIYYYQYGWDNYTDIKNVFKIDKNRNDFDIGI